MALKIRLRKQGRHNRPFFRLVLADCRSPRDGKYVECLGWYNPFETDLEKSIKVDAERLQHWVNLGAEISENSETLIAKGAPHVLKAAKEKRLAAQAKITAKRRASRKRRAEKAKAK